MTPFYYQPATGFDAWRQTGPVKKLLEGYFVDDGGFLVATIIAIVVAFAFSLVFYLMGRKFSFSKLGVWLTMFFVSGIVSFGLTAFCSGTLTDEKAEIGITSTFKKQKEKIKDKEERASYEDTIKGTKVAKKSNSQDKANSDKNKKSKRSRKVKNSNYLKFFDNPVAKTVCCLNFVYTLFLFWIFSLLFKDERLKITKYAFDIPHKWPQRK